MLKRVEIFLKAPGGLIVQLAGRLGLWITGSDITSGRESKSCTSNFVIIVNSKYALFIILKADIIYGMHIAYRMTRLKGDVFMRTKAKYCATTLELCLLQISYLNMHIFSIYIKVTILLQYYTFRQQVYLCTYLASQLIGIVCVYERRKYSSLNISQSRVNIQQCTMGSSCSKKWQAPQMSVGANSKHFEEFQYNPNFHDYLILGTEF